jgi:hypothetical protein
MRAPAVLGGLAVSLALPAAAAAHTLHVRDEGKLRFVKASGSAVIDEGAVHGNLPGSGRVRFTYNGNPTVSASFVIWGRGWSVSGRASGRLSNPNSPAPSFRGKLTITGGSGTYKHASGDGELFGVFNRRSYGLTVQTIGTLRS